MSKQNTLETSYTMHSKVSTSDWIKLCLGEEEDSKTDKMERVGYQGSYYNQVANSKYIRYTDLFII